MKYTKLFMFALGAMFVASCSNDEGELNTLQTTVSFQQDTLSIKENSGIVNIPIAIEGYRNGDVAVEVVAEGSGANAAKEGENFLITDKTLQLLAKNDTTSSAVLNVQLKTIDDQEINEPRELTITIKSAEGAQLGKTQKIVVILRDNDAAFYEKFFGKWTLSGYYMAESAGAEPKPFSKTIIISGAVDEDDLEYNNILWVTAPALFNVGVALDCEWPMQYTFDKETKTGTLSHIMGQNYVATYGSSYQWMFLTDDGTNLSDDLVTATWQLGDDNAFPTEISWEMETPDDPYRWIYLYQPGNGVWNGMSDLKMVKQ